MTGWALAGVSVTLKVKAVVPSPSRAVTSVIDSDEPGSSSAIVPVACPSATTALVAPDRLTRKVSLGSSTVSLRTGTAQVPVVAPGLMVTVAFTAV